MAGEVSLEFILIEPETAANVGAVCRALRNTGFDKLHVVNPKCDIYSGEARALAHRSFDLLESAATWRHLDELSGSFDYLVATTADKRDTKKRYISVEQLRDFTAQSADACLRIGLVFGRERNGLTTREISMCDMVSSLPMATQSPTINLSQAVMLYSFLLSRLNDSPRPQKRDDLVLHPQENQVFREQTANFLAFLGLEPTARSYVEVQSRIPILKARDKRLLMFLWSRLRKRLRVKT